MHVCICDFLLDIVQNSFEAESTTVVVTLEETDTVLSCTVCDDGRGMDAKLQKRVVDPFYTDGRKHVGRKVGLGLPFLVQATGSAGGTFSLQSEVGKGTTVAFGFDLDNIDTPPFGDLPSTLMALLSHPLTKELTIRRSLSTKKGSEAYEVSKSTLESVLGPLRESGVLVLLLQYLQSQEEDLQRFSVVHIPRLDGNVRSHDR